MSDCFCLLVLDWRVRANGYREELNRRRYNIWVLLWSPRRRLSIPGEQYRTRILSWRRENTFRWQRIVVTQRWYGNYKCNAGEFEEQRN